MFKNIGRKIKGLAIVLCWICIVASIIFGIIILVGAGNLRISRQKGITILSGIGVALGGSLISWVGSFFLYGFGQLVENSDKLSHSTEELIRLNGRHITSLKDIEAKIQKKEKPETKEEEPARTKQEEETVDYDTPKEGDWICPNCGQRNRSYVATCIDCLTSRPK